MNDFTRNYLIILVSLLSTVHSTYPPEEDSLNGPGIAACRWYGMLPVLCNKSVPVEIVPRECTSLFYEGLSIDLEYNITDTLDNATGLIEKIMATNLNVMVYFSHSNRAEWLRVFDVSPEYVKMIAENDMKSLKSYVDQHNGIKGFIIQFLESHDLNNFSENIKIYFDVMRSTFPGLAIGMVMHCDQLLYFQKYLPEEKWLDFDILSSTFDFYILNLFDINNCVDEFVETGVFPLTGDYSIDTSNISAHNIITVDSLKNYVEDLGVPMSKLYIEYQPYGTLKDPSGDTCTAYYESICSAKIKSDDNELCADTQQTFYEKGQYAKKNSQGFIISIDLDDAECSCECGRPFPVFYALLDGFNGVSPEPVCPLFDRS